MTLVRALIHQLPGQWPKNEVAGTITLDFEHRHRRRVRMTTDQGEEVLLDLPSAAAMTDGDGLRLHDGRWIEVRAAAECVIEVRHPDARQLMRLARHLGNRHLPTQIDRAFLRIRPDHVIEAMLKGFGADLLKVHATFQPEGGAYGEHHDGHSDAIAQSYD